MRRRIAGLVLAASAAAVTVPATPAHAITCGELDLVCAIVCTAGQKYGIRCGY